MLDAYDEKEVKLISASFVLGYGILILFSHDYLKELKPVHVIAQSVISGMVFTLLPIVIYARTLSFEGLNEKTSKRKLEKF